MRTVTLNGASVLDGDALTIVVAGVTQDEPVNGNGSGEMAPDAVLLSGGTSQVRAERRSNGDGRVYSIEFAVFDDRGWSCTGVATVGVPHDSAHNAPVDSGGQYDSLST